MPHYQISSDNPAGHYFDVVIRIDTPDPAGQGLRLPNWIPGSYMIRDFARNLLDLRASDASGERAIRQIDKSNWLVAAGDGPMQVSYRVYAWDLSVRAAHLDLTHGYFNGSSVFLEVLGQGEQACELNIMRPSPASCADWRVATSLPRKQAESFAFGLYEARDYDELIDHPVEMGEFTRIPFEACDVPHDIVLSGRFDCDEERLAADLKTICEHHIRFFGEPAPMDYYQFQVLVVGEGYGGLEHRASTSLMAARNGLPAPGGGSVSAEYRDFLGLCSHEYFHTWNVKRIKPAVYRPYDLQREVYTDLLWAFEGITSYYDDLALVRAGLIEPASYLELLAQTMTRVERGAGRRRQSTAESSFNTWTKFYKQDENAANAIVSYYAKGCLIAACIDLKMRAVSAGRVSLDDLMRRLWRDHGEQGGGVERDTIQGLVTELAGVDLGEFCERAIYGTGELPLVDLLEDAGIEVRRRAAAGFADKGGKAVEREPRADFGALLKADVGQLAVLRVAEQGGAQMAGLSAGDLIVAVDGLRLDLARFETRLAQAAAGDCWRIHAFRRDELHAFDVTLTEPAVSTYVLNPGYDAADAWRAWLTPSTDGA